MRRLFALCVLVLAAALSIPALAWAETDALPPSRATDAQVKEVLSVFDEDMTAATLSSDAGGVTTYAGANMFETAAIEAWAAYPDGAKSAVIAGPGDAWVDALASAGLAASRGPILFAQADGLGNPAQFALDGMGVESVVIVGGTASVSEAVEKDLAAMGIKVEARLAGDNCYETQMAIYNFGTKNKLWGGNMAIVATGTSFGDALSVSPVAYDAKAPIFLVNAEGELLASARKALNALGKKGSLKTVLAIGGTASVPAAVEDYLRGLLPEKGGACERLFGENQYETSAAIAHWAVKNRAFTATHAAFATGLMPYDALAGSVLQGVTKAPLLLADDPANATIAFLEEHRGDVGAIRFLGGTAAVPEVLRANIVSRLSDRITLEDTGISYDAMLDLEVAYIEQIDSMLPKSARLEYTRHDLDDCMEPTQFVWGDEEYYQFAVLNGGYSGKVDAIQINDFIARFGQGGMLMGQGDAFINAARESGVNEVFLLALAIIESGWGLSSLAMGTEVGGKTYYNFFGIGAGDADPQGGGTAAANEYGWDSPENCVKGAGTWIARQFLNNSYNQNTLYKMKWNYVQAAHEGTVWKKYASGCMWAIGIAGVMANFYNFCGMRPEDTGLTFLVPAYR